MSEAVDVLNAINRSLREIIDLIKSSMPPQVATDADLDGKHGNPLLKFTPRDWAGPSFKEHRFSECPPGLLDLVADANDYFARVADEKGEKTEKGHPVSKYKRSDAARARGWAKRLRAGWVPSAGSFEAPAATQGAAPPTWAQPAEQPDEDEVPF